jgi:malate dehydrogenase (oxaloacetate-decarboxylating)(NADP+)
MYKMLESASGRDPGMATSHISDDLKSRALAYHRAPKPGKLAITATKPLATQHDLALAYTPGVWGSATSGRWRASR